MPATTPRLDEPAVVPLLGGALPRAASAGVQGASVATLRSELRLARRQLDGYESETRVGAQVVGREVHPPAEGVARDVLLAEIARLEARVANVERARLPGHGSTASPATPMPSTVPTSGSDAGESVARGAGAR
jgi:hypothetical protein